jgi:adenylate kinase
MQIIVYGSEGSGKTTQAKMLAQKLGIPHLNSGDIVREYARNDTGRLGEICRQALATGHYVADSDMFILWQKRLEQPDTTKGWVIDGFPRDLSQIQFLEKKLKTINKKLDIVFYLTIREKIAIERLLKRGRRNPDGTLHDTPEIIKERLRRFKSQTRQVLNFYKKKGILQIIDGEKTIEEIHKDVASRIAQL